MQIEKARVQSQSWVPSQIVAAAKRLDPVVFCGLSRTTVEGWIETSVSGKRHWKDSVLSRVSRGNEPGHSKGGRHGILVRERLVEWDSLLISFHSKDKHPDVVDAIKSCLLQLRGNHAPLTVITMRGVILATVTTMRPEILQAKFGDGSTFKASDTFVRCWVRRHLNWTERKATRAAQKLPVNWEEVCNKSRLRKAYSIKEFDITAKLYVNSDQTQGVYAPGDKMTYAETGAKQVSLVGGDEKRAFTIMVSVASNGTLLPFQAIFEGKTELSCPSKTVSMPG
jgi:hypothetical protein